MTSASRTPRAVGWVLGAIAAFGIAFVISPFDATVRGDIGIGVLERTGSATSTGIAVGIATFVIDGLCALGVALGLWANPSWTVKLDRWVSRLLGTNESNSAAEDKAGGLSRGASAASNLSLSVGVGAGLVLLKYPTAEPQRWFRLGAMYTAINSVLLGIVGWMVGGGANWMGDHGFGWFRRGIIRWVPDPWLWTAIFVGTVIVPFLYREWSARSVPVVEPEAST